MHDSGHKVEKEKQCMQKRRNKIIISFWLTIDDASI